MSTLTKKISPYGINATYDGPIHVIYHANCPDGYTAMDIIRTKYENVVIHEGVYEQAPPLEHLSGALLFIVDFSYPPEQLEQICDVAKFVWVFDHHKSAQEDLANFQAPNCYINFDMNRSGAGITWDELYFGNKRPLLVDYVEDRDLWRFQLPHSHTLASLFMAYEMTQQNWAFLSSAFDTNINGLMAEAKAITMYREKLINEAVALSRQFNIGGYDVLVAPALYSIGSDVAGRLCEGRPFAGYYVDRPDVRQFGLRSDDGGMDVSLIAKMYKGGGHAHAAGFKVGRKDYLAVW